MPICVRSAAAVAVVAGLAVAVSADTFTFNNDCGTGMWGTLCPIGGGVYQSNWGRTGAPSPALLPAAEDQVNIVGAVAMDVSPSVAFVSIPAGAMLNWNSTTLTGAVSNSGTVFNSTGFNKFFVGTGTNNAGGLWRVAEGSLYLAPGNLANSVGGTLSLEANGSVRRSGGATADCVLDNRGVLTVSGGDSLVGSVTVAGQASGVWLVQPGASLTFDSVLFSGLLRGDHDGTTNMTGGIGLAADAQLTTEPGSNPWAWSSATVNTGVFTLTNSGGLQLYSGFNKFFTGTAVNAPTGVWSIVEGNLYITPSNDASTISNSGLLEIGSAGLRRSGGAIENAVLSNSGIVRATNGTATLGDITLLGTNGTWATAPGASLTLNSVRLGGVFVGDHAATTNFTGGVSLASNATLTTAPSSAAPWGWSSASVDTGAFTLTNAGRLRTYSGFNKFFTGTAVNGPEGVWEFAEGALYLAPSTGLTSMTNNGTMTMSSATTLSRSGGSIADARFVNNAIVESTGSSTRFQAVGAVSNGGIWRTSAGASMQLDSLYLAGTFVGDHAGDAAFVGSSLLTANTMFTTVASSQLPWQWTSATIDAGAFTLTNSGRMRTSSGFNKFFSGSMVNAGGALFECVEGNFYLAPGGSSGVASLTNNGTITFTGGTSIFRSGGTVAAASLTNNGLIEVLGGSSRIDGMVLTNGAAGLIRVDSGAVLTLPADWSMGGGRLDGAGTFDSGNQGFVNAGGTVAPGLGAATGTLTTPHRFTQTAGGTLEIGLVSNGTTQTIDKLALSSAGFNGQAVLGGTLRVTLPADTSPAPIGGVDMVIVDAPGGLTGQFATVTEANPIDGYRYMVIYTPTQALLRIIRRCGGADFGSAGADTNFDGLLDNNDFIVYINLFFAQDPSADVGVAGGSFGSDGLFDNNDFISFIDIFFSGCH